MVKMTTKQNEKMIRKLEREWRAALLREEEAADLAAAWRLAAASDRALRRLEAARQGIEIPAPRTARNLGRAGFAALAQLGKVISRSIKAKASLAMAQAKAAALRAAKLTRAALRRSLAAVVAVALAFIATKEQDMAPKMIKATITAVQIDGSWGGERCRLVRYEAEDGSWAWVPGDEELREVIEVEATPPRCTCTQHSHEELTADDARWSALPLVGVHVVEADEYGPREELELRNCSCGSTLARLMEGTS